MLKKMRKLGSPIFFKFIATPLPVLVVGEENLVIGFGLPPPPAPHFGNTSAIAGRQPVGCGQTVGLLAIFRGPRVIRLHKVFMGRTLAAKKVSYTNNNKNLSFNVLRVKQSNSFSPGSTWPQKQNF